MSFHFYLFTLSVLSFYLFVLCQVLLRINYCFYVKYHLVLNHFHLIIVSCLYSYSFLLLAHRSRPILLSPIGPTKPPHHGLPVLGLLPKAHFSMQNPLQDRACTWHFQPAHPDSPYLFFSPVPSIPLAWTPMPPTYSLGHLSSSGCLEPSPYRVMSLLPFNEKDGNPGERGEAWGR